MEGFITSGEKLGLQGEALKKFVDSCIEREEREKERELKKLEAEERQKDREERQKERETELKRLDIELYIRQVSIISILEYPILFQFL